MQRQAGIRMLALAAAFGVLAAHAYADEATPAADKMPATETTTKAAAEGAAGSTE